MKRALRVLVPILLVLVVLGSVVWYFLVYDQALTKEILLRGARYFESQGNHEVSTYLYDLAYSQSSQDDDVAIELAQQYLLAGNYTKAEYTISNAIADNPSAQLYVELSKIYLQQDKLLDAVNLLDAVLDPHIRNELEAMRPAAPVLTPEPGFYSQYITVEGTCEGGTLYLNTNGEYPSLQKDQFAGPITLELGETVIYALNVGDNGLVSPLSVYGYTIGGVVEQVEFADETIETIVRDILQAGPRDVIFTNHLWNIEELTIPASVKSFDDLPLFTGLRSLTIEKGAAGDLTIISKLEELEYLSLDEYRLSSDEVTAISTLKNLKHLSLPAASLSSIASFESLTQLEYLDLSSNTLRNINAIGGMKYLKELYLGHNVITSLDALSSLTSLEKLDISYNAVTSLEPLRGMYGSMTELYASHNQITSVGALADLRKLTILDLSHNNIGDVAVFGQLTQMEELNLSNNALSDIASLESMTKLRVLNFAYNMVTALPAFQPGCQLVSIDASYNQLMEIESLANLPWLNNVNVDYNAELESLEPLDSCPVLVRVNAFGTKVTDVSFLTAKSIIVNFDPTLPEEEDKD